MSKKTKISLLLITLICFALIATTYGQRKYPLLGKDMIVNIAVMEEHGEVLEHWRTKGFRDAVLVNIDAHDDLKRVPQEQLTGLQQTPTGLANGNFIHAAAKLGIVGRVVWVVPASYDIFSDSGERLQRLLGSYGFPDEDINTFRLKDGCFNGTSGNIPLAICDLGSLPDIRQPVLISFDADFFPAMLTQRQLKVVDAVKQTFVALYRKEYAVMDATVAYSVSGGYLDSSQRWIGDLVIDSLRIPGLISLPRMTSRYEFLQGTDLLMRMGRYEELLKDVVTLPPEQEEEPSLLIYAAKAYQRTGDIPKAFRYAEQACLRDRRYCSALTELGVDILDQKGVRAAEPFFLRGYELNPSMDNGQFRLAMALRKAGRYSEAITYFRIFRNGYGPFPVDFYLADTCMLKGDNVGARLYYDSGRTELIGNPALLTGFGDMSIIEKGALYYDSQGEKSSAAQLRQLAKSRNFELNDTMELQVY